MHTFDRTPGAAVILPLLCRYKARYGRHFCLTSCPASAPDGVFRYARVESPADLPPEDARVIDVAVLDMNHGWPNLGHDSLVHAVQDAACDMLPALENAGLRVRALSFDVRRRHVVPEPPGGRFTLYLGTGGPGHIDPYRNDGLAAGSQGIREDPRWEEPLFRLYDAILADEGAALLSVCHSFGVMCRWQGVAEPVLRPLAKGGKSAGILENVLTPEARAHPWFSRLSAALPDGERLRVVDHRLFDLIPRGPSPPPFVPIGYETLGVGGPRGDALTMMEFARDRGGVMPRVFGSNHHPEIVDRARQKMILQQKLDRGEVTIGWFEERALVLSESYPDEDSDQRLHVTSDYTLLAPLRYYLQRQVRERAQRLGLEMDVDEKRIVEETGRAAIASPLESPGAA